MSRPAETGGVAAALSVLIAYVLKLRDPAVITALAVVVGFLPAAITWAVETVRGRVGPPVAQEPAEANIGATVRHPRHPT